VKENKRVLVIDASIAVKLFLPEDHSDRAVKIFSMLNAKPPALIFVPELFFIECANVFRSRYKLGGMTSVEAKRAFEILCSFPLQSLSTAELSSMALDLALRHDISVYDACYLAASIHLNARLLTADKKLVGKLKNTNYDVAWIDGY